MLKTIKAFISGAGSFLNYLCYNGCDMFRLTTQFYHIDHNCQSIFINSAPQETAYLMQTLQCLICLVVSGLRDSIRKRIHISNLQMMQNRQAQKCLHTIKPKFKIYRLFIFSSKLILSVWCITTFILPAEYQLKLAISFQLSDKFKRIMFGLFQRTKNENGKYKKPYYSFRSLKADKVIDLCQDGDNQGSLIIWDGHGGENQSFTIIQSGPDVYIKCKHDKRYLTVESQNDGARIFTAPKSGQANQKFRIDEHQLDSKEYVIYTFCGKVLDVAEASTDNGAQVIQWDYNGGKNQLWNLCDPQNITSSSSEIE